MFVYQKSPHINEKTEVDPFLTVFFFYPTKKHKSVFEYECIVIELPKLETKNQSISSSIPWNGEGEEDVDWWMLLN